MLWLYAVVDAVPDALPAPQLGGGDLEVVAGDGLAAVVEPLATAPTARPDTLRSHDLAVRALAERVPSLLPARFGQTAADAAELRRRLGERTASFTAALDRVRGCLQVTTRLLPDGEEAVNVEVGPSEDEIDDTTDGSAVGPGRRYLRRRRQERRIPAFEELAGALAGRVRESRSRRGPAPALATAYHLVPRERVDEVLAVLAAYPPPPGTALRVSGPSPPYAFVEDPP